MNRSMKSIDLNVERRRNFYQRILEYVDKEKYTIANQAIQHFQLSGNINKENEVAFCQSLFWYVDERYKEFALNKCVVYLHKQYGGKVYIKL